VDGFLGKSVRENALRGGITREQIIKIDNTPAIKGTKLSGLNHSEQHE